MPYETTSLADEDVIRVYVYGNRMFGTAQAESYFADLIRCFDLLAEHPLLVRSDLNSLRRCACTSTKPTSSLIS